MRLPKSTAAAALLWLAAALAPATRAATFALPTDGSNMVGEIRVVTLADPRNTLLDIGRHFDLGYNEITAANPGVSVWMPGAGTRIVVPTEFILPPKPWVGIVVDVPQRRLYYFPTPRPGEPARVITFPVGIARPGWPTPLGSTRIIAKYKDPSWIVPKDILQEHHQEGDARFPSYFPPGPGNPMGMLAMQTGFPAIFIHGTNRPWGVGMEVSHGCVHLYPEDAADLFPRLPVGTPVRVARSGRQPGRRAVRERGTARGRLPHAGELPHPGGGGVDPVPQGPPRRRSRSGALEGPARRSQCAPHHPGAHRTGCGRHRTADRRPRARPLCRPALRHRRQQRRRADATPGHISGLTPAGSRCSVVSVVLM